ncbi:MAG: ABC transporter permease [Synergistaceae bacterium]|jgi:putative ABC transport system permease protein|nr:ABC transporter permease [Synergistaceae bacterium]
MFYRMLKGALTRRTRNMAMIAFTMALGVSLATAMLNVMMDVGDKVNQELKTYGANLTVVPRGMSFMSELYEFEDDYVSQDAHMRQTPRKYLSEDDLPKMKMIFWAYNIVDFTPFLEMTASAGGERILLVGTWFGKRLELPTGETVETGMKRLKNWWDVEGEWPLDDEKGAMLGESLAARLKMKIGDTFEVGGAGESPQARQKFTVKAVFHGGGAEDEWAFVPLKLVQDLSGRPGLVERVDVSALTTPENDLARRAAQDPNSLSRKEWDTWYCTAYISSIAYQIEEVVAGSRAKPVLQVAESEGTILKKTQLLMLLLTLLSLLCSALAISNLVTAGVMERSAELGLLKALGATNGAVFLLILAELAVTSILGGAAGYFAGLGFAQVIGRTVFGSAIAAKGLVIPIVSILILLVALLGSLPAMRMLFTLRPTEVLHGR